MAAEGFNNNAAASVAASGSDDNTSRRIGVDRDEAVLKAALEAGAVEEAVTPDKAAEAVERADLIVLCLYPNAAFGFLREYADLVKPGAVVTDVCGVKSGFVEESAALVPQASYVGSHPMAGRELAGYGAAVRTLFKGCNYIITPSSAVKDSAVHLVHDFALHLGAARINYTDADSHDRRIAYTSQLAHVLAAAVVQNPIFEECGGYVGGSLEDITRVAKLNSEMWSELFICNRRHLSDAVSQLEASLAKLRLMIESENYDALNRELAESSRCKERWLS